MYDIIFQICWLIGLLNVWAAATRHDFEQEEMLDQIS